MITQALRSWNLARHAWILIAILTATSVIYWPGLNGGYTLDDYPNIIDNKGVQPDKLSLASISAAALSSPSSQFKRPLASVSFASNYLLTGLDPFWMKLTNLVIHLANGLLLYLLALCLLKAIPSQRTRNPEFIAACIAAGWLILPINLTAVLYVVQRMESMAHLFVFAGLLGYCRGRLRMLQGRPGAWLACTSVLSGTVLGLLAKETAILLPLYAALIELFIYRLRRPGHLYEVRILAFFIAFLLIPLGVGLIWQLGIVLNPATWLARDFTLSERLLSEARIVLNYIKWTIIPLPWDLSFYHDDFEISRSLFSPWTTAAAIIGVSALAFITVKLRHQKPLVALGFAMYLGAHSLTATILPLELVYEHRNYFASFGLLIALIPWLLSTAAPRLNLRLALAGSLYLSWAIMTAWTAKSWAHPITLAQEFATRAPTSPRAQYALAHAYLTASNYQPKSPYLDAAIPILERTAAMPNASILPESALIYLHSYLGWPIAQNWWDSMLRKIKDKRLDVQDEAAITSLSTCAREASCILPIEKMIEMFSAALAQTKPSARILAAYGDYAWNVLNDRALALRLSQDAALLEPQEPVYLITLLKMQLALGNNIAANETIAALNKINTFSRLNDELEKLAPLRIQTVDSTPPPKTVKTNSESLPCKLNCR